MLSVCQSLCFDFKHEGFVWRDSLVAAFAIRNLAWENTVGFGTWAHHRNHFTEPWHHVLQWEIHGLAMAGVEFLAIGVLAGVNHLHHVGGLESVARALLGDLIHQS